MRARFAIPMTILALALACAGARAEAPVRWPHAERLFGAAETVIRRASIPAGVNPHGELVVLRRGDAIVVRTTLVSALLGRGLQSIRRKELARWPEGADGHADSTEYLKSLAAAEDVARDEFLARSNQNDDRRKMMSELVLGGKDAFFASYAIDARKVDDGFEVLAARPVMVRDASVAYIRGAMRTQCANAFKLTDAELDALLGSP